MTGPCPIQGHWKCSLAGTAPKYALVFKDTRHWSHLDLWVWLVVHRTSELKVFLHLCWEQFTTDPPPSAPAAAAAGAESRSKTQWGQQQLTLLGSPRLSSGKVWKGNDRPPGGDGTLASSPALSTAAYGQLHLALAHSFRGYIDFGGCMGSLAPALQCTLGQTSSPCSAPQPLSIIYHCSKAAGEVVASLQRLLVWGGTELHTGWCSLIFTHPCVLQFGYIWGEKFPFWL